MKCIARRKLLCLAPITLILLQFFIAQHARAQAETTNNATPRILTRLEIPDDTVLPVRLDHGLSSKNAKAGQAISGRIMQDVPLPNNRKIPAGSKVSGTVLSAQRSGGARTAESRFDLMS